ncbi:MAG: ankyrin repeat domain-containing protein, partial [Acidobacteria bacterium]|nr:ankyrin repeat domain-containing protein [Acidobacteriota bacterium]
TPLIGAAASGDLALVETLLEHGADVEAADRGGGTPWTHAFKKGHLHITKVLEAAAVKKSPPRSDAPRAGTKPVISSTICPSGR